MSLQPNNSTTKSKLERENLLISEIVAKKGKKRIASAYKKKKAKKKTRRQKKRRMEKRVLFSFAKGRKMVSRTTIYIQSTHNNTIYTVASAGGKTKRSISPGMCGFKNTRKSTSHASQVTAEKLQELGKRKTTVSVKIRGLGAGKLSGVRALNRLGFRIRKIEECTTLPHNGCRPPKCRRL